MNANNPDPMAELDAMRTVAEALTGLEPDGVARVLRWASEKFGVSMRPSQAGRSSLPADNLGGDQPNAPTFSDLAELYTTASPKTDADKALVVGYWHQYGIGAADFDTQSVNTELKNLGYGIGNITRAFDALKDSRPALAVQTRKDGTTKQARKRFKLTNEGKKRVEMLCASAE